MPFWAYFLNSTYRAYAPMIGVNKDLLSYLSMIINYQNNVSYLYFSNNILLYFYK